jgi:hypothetical protein
MLRDKAGPAELIRPECQKNEPINNLSAVDAAEKRRIKRI